MGRTTNRPVRRRKSVSHYSDDNPNTFTVKPPRSEQQQAAPPAAKRRRTPSTPTTVTNSFVALATKSKPKLRRKSSSPTLLTSKQLKNQADATSNTSTRRAISKKRRFRPVPVAPVAVPHDVSLPHALTVGPLLSADLSWQCSHPDRPVVWLSRLVADDSTNNNNMAWTADTRGTLSLWECRTRRRPVVVVSLDDDDDDVSSSNSAVQCTGTRAMVVRRTATALQICSIAPQQKLLSSMAIRLTAPVRKVATQQTPVLSLQCVYDDPNKTRYRLLWTMSHVELLSKDKTDTTIEENKNGSLMLMEWDEPVHAPPFAAPSSPSPPIVVTRTLLQAPADCNAFVCWTTLWEKGKGTFLMICQTASDQVEIVRASVEGNRMAFVDREKLPHAKATDCCLQEYDNRIFITGFRGIRMLDRDHLQTITIFGENVTLHGRTVLWNRCVWLQAPRTVTTTSQGRNNNKQQRTTHVPDALAEHEISSTRTMDEFWLVGIPHPYKGPSELQSTLYIWKPQSADTVTVHGPPKGCLGDFFIAPDWKSMMGVAAETGQVYDWTPSTQSDFAGIMYPVGYKVISDNIEYIEEEDELDQVVVAEDEDARDDEDDTTMTDPDLAEAMRLSLLEHNKQQLPDEVPVSVRLLADDNDKFIVPCWPEVQEEEGSDPQSPTVSPKRVRATSLGITDKTAFEHLFLAGLPEYKFVEKRLQAMQDNAETAVPVDQKLKPKGKRGRTANVEALLQSSIRSELQLHMDRLRRTWSTGAGSTLRPARVTAHSIVHSASAEEKALAMELLLLSPTNQEKGTAKGAPSEVESFSTGRTETTADSSVTPSEPSPANGTAASTEKCGEGDNVRKTVAVKRQDVFVENVACAACRGRMVLHACKKREKPVDYDALVRAEQEEKAREEEERLRVKTERRRAAEAKRREARRQKKLEEEQRAAEEATRMRNELCQQQHRERELQDAMRLEYEQRQNLYENDYPLYQKNEPPHASGGQVLPEPDCPSYQQSSGHHSPNTSPSPRATTATASADQGFQSNAPASSWSTDRVLSTPASLRTGKMSVKGSVVKPSTSLDEIEALAALAGLADRLAPVGAKSQNTGKYATLGTSDVSCRGATDGTQQDDSIQLNMYASQGAEEKILHDKPESHFQGYMSGNPSSDATPFNPYEYRVSESRRKDVLRHAFVTQDGPTTLVEGNQTTNTNSTLVVSSKCSNEPNGAAMQGTSVLDLHQPRQDSSARLPNASTMVFKENSTTERLPNGLAAQNHFASVSEESQVSQQVCTHLADSSGNGVSINTSQLGSLGTEAAALLELAEQSAAKTFSAAEEQIAKQVVPDGTIVHPTRQDSCGAALGNVGGGKNCTS